MFEISEDVNNNLMNLYCIIDSYSVLSVNQAEAHCQPCIFDQSQVTQESDRLYNFIMATPTETTKYKIL